MAELKLIADSGGGTIALKAPATTTSNAAITLKLPVADGSANQLLKTDGSGQLGWATDSATDSTKMPLAGGTFTGDTLYNDSVKAKFGTGSDLQIYHDGHSRVKTSSSAAGNLVIDSNNDINLRVNDSEMAVHCKENTSVELYYDNSKKLETSSTGVSVTGQVVATTNFKGADSVDLVLGTGSDFRILHDGTDNVLTSDGGQSIRLVNHLTGGNETMGKFIPNGGVELYHNNVRKLNTEVAGIRVDGASGANGILALYGNAGNTNSDLWRLESTAGGSNFYIKNGASGSWENNILTSGNGIVRLYYDNSGKLETTADGITIGGDSGVTGNWQLETYNGSGSCGNVFAGTGGAYLYIQDTGSGEKIGILANGQASITSYKSGDPMVFSTTDGSGTAERLRIASDGKVGIGETSPDELLHIKSTSVPSIELEQDDGTSYKGLAQLRGNDLEIRGSSGNIEFYTGNNDGASSTERLRITSDGKVGIGTDSPDQTLHVHKGSAGSIASSASAVVTIENNNTAVLQFLTPNNVGAQIRFGDPDDSGKGWIEYGHSSDSLMFGTNGPEKLRIASDGKVHINRTTALDSNYVNFSATKALSAGIPQNQVNIGDAAAYNTTDNGGAIGFSAIYSSGGAYTTMASIEGVKTNNTDGNYNGDMVFKTRSHNGNNVTRMRLIDAGLCFGTDTAAANALDDYESGTYTPQLLASGGSGLTPTYTTQQGLYTKIGDIVYYSAEIDWSAKSGAESNSTAYLTVSLPFTPVNHSWGNSTVQYNTGLEFDNGGAYCHHGHDGAYTYFWSPLDSGRLDYYPRTSNLHSSGSLYIAGVFKVA